MLLKCIEKCDFDRAAKLDAHYYERLPERSRWNYYQHAIEMIERSNLRSAIELGPYLLPLIKGADTIDHDSALRPNFLFDASVVPWPIERKNPYEIFVGLQVLEHLGNNQPSVFEEIQRIAKSAVISLPYLWNTPHNVAHHNISDSVIARWTQGMVPDERRIVAPDGSTQTNGDIPFSRVILRYVF